MLQTNSMAIVVDCSLNGELVNRTTNTDSTALITRACLVPGHKGAYDWCDSEIHYDSEIESELGALVNWLIRVASYLQRLN